MSGFVNALQYIESEVLKDMPSKQANYNPYRRCVKDARVHGQKETKATMYWDVPEAVLDEEDKRLKAAEKRQRQAEATTARKLSHKAKLALATQRHDDEETAAGGDGGAAGEIASAGQELDFRREIVREHRQLVILIKAFVRDGASVL